MVEVFEYLGSYIVVKIYIENNKYIFATYTTDNIDYIFFSNENSEELNSNGIYDTFDDCLNAVKEFWKDNEYIEKDFMNI
jgi:hypothetical protein